MRPATSADRSPGTGYPLGVNCLPIRWGTAVPGPRPRSKRSRDPLKQAVVFIDRPLIVIDGVRKHLVKADRTAKGR